MVKEESKTTFFIKRLIFIRHPKFIKVNVKNSKYCKVNVVEEKLTLVKPFVMLKNVGQNIILLAINPNQPNILLITKNTPSCGVFYLLL